VHVTGQYADDRNLAARQSMWAYATGPALAARALDLAGLDGADTVVDVGCGNGSFLAELRSRGHRGPLLGLDLSPGMAAVAARHAPTAAADARALPLPSAAVDAALAPHMLYHVPEPARAVAELRRVVRPGGVVLITTNGAGHRAQVQAVLDAATRRVTGRAAPSLEDADAAFDAAVGAALLPTVFGAVVAHDLTTELEVPDPAAVVGYLASFEPELSGLAGSARPALLAEISALVSAEMAAHGSFHVTSRAVAYICR
jgi:SAM-dependent methyltransferase